MASANSDKERKARPEIEGIQSLSPQEGGQFLLLNLKSRLVEIAPLNAVTLLIFCFYVPAIYL